MHGLPVHQKEVGAQRGVSGDEPAHGLEHQVGFEGDVHLDGPADAVRVTVGVEVLEEPERLLVLGQRVPPFVGVEPDRAIRPFRVRRGGQSRESVVEPVGELPGRGAAEQGDHREGDAEFGVDPGP